MRQAQVPGTLETILTSLREELLYVLFGTVLGILQAMVVQVKTGHTGLRFRLGRAKKVLNHGTHFQIPFLHTSKVVPTRSRTLDLPGQRVVTFEGLVVHAEANLVWRIVDIKKALIEVDDVEEALYRMLRLWVQEVLRRTTREELADADMLGDRLTEHLSSRVTPWGVTVERAGFPSIAPSPQTLRITQLENRTRERHAAAKALALEGIAPRQTLAFVGTRTMPRRKFVRLSKTDLERRRLRRLRGLAKRAGWKGPEILRAERRLGVRPNLYEQASVAEVTPPTHEEEMKRSKSENPFDMAPFFKETTKPL